MSRKNILFVASHFPPTAGPAGQRPAKFCRYLPEFGYRPLVLTVADRQTLHAADPTLLDELGDTAIYRCGTFKPWPIRLLRRYKLEGLPKALLLASPDIGALTWQRPALREARKIAQGHHVDAIYTTVGPFSTAVLGRRLKRLLGGIPWVLDYRDPWTTAYKHWPTRLHYLREVRQERQALEAADAVVVVTPTMKDLLVEAFPHVAGKIHMITNGYDRNDIPRAFERVSSDVLRIGFTGSTPMYRSTCPGRKWSERLFFGKAEDYLNHSPIYLFRAVRALLDRRPEWKNRIALSLAGATVDSYESLVRTLRLEDVVSLLGYLPHAESVRVLLNSDVLFLPLPTPPEGMRSYIYTGKLFEYLAVGKPILAAAPEGDARDLIERVGAGWCVGPRDVAAIASRLERLIEAKASGTLAIRSDRELVARFERRALTAELAKVFDALCRPQMESSSDDRG